MIRRKFDSKVRKVGNSYVITVPSNIIRKFKLKQGKFITTSIEIENDGKK
jgi:antitoxin component of MazEF toxin-antitoxin module